MQQPTRAISARPAAGPSPADVVTGTTEAPGRAIAEAVADVRTRIALACERSHRDPREITLVGATKTIPVERIREALDAGVMHLGENRLQEALAKMRALADRAPTWHLIGHLQSNKARLAAEVFDVIESVDSLRIARILEEDALEIGRELDVFVQVNVGNEPTKHGVSAADVAKLIEEVDSMPSILVTGLMAIPPPRSSLDESKRDFRALKELFDRLRADRPEIRHLSMGMSADFEAAIEEGATEIRVGAALFGLR